MAATRSAGIKRARLEEAKEAEEAEEAEEADNDIPDDVTTLADAEICSYECITKLKKLEGELSSERAQKDFIQMCQEDCDFLYS